MKIRDATILLVAMALVVCCGPPQQQEVQTLEKVAKLEQTIESLQEEIKQNQAIIQGFKIPQITVGYYSDKDCVVIPETTIADKMKVRFVNQTDVDATFSFPNPIFDPPVFTVAAGKTEIKNLALGAKAFPKTDYGVNVSCYSEPLPGPFIIIPEN